MGLWTSYTLCSFRSQVVAKVACAVIGWRVVLVFHLVNTGGFFLELLAECGKYHKVAVLLLSDESGKRTSASNRKQGIDREMVRKKLWLVREQEV
jgi:hypothetical protein